MCGFGSWQLNCAREAELIPVLTAEQMGAADRRAIDQLGIPGQELMERAGSAVAHEIAARFDGVDRVAVLCGKGNNGGDGFVVARHLREARPEVFLIGRVDDVGGDASVHLSLLREAGCSVSEIVDAEAWAAVSERVCEAGLIVDAMLGTGLSEAPRGVIARVVEDLQSVPRERIVAVDLPSGLSSDTGDVDWPTVGACLTVTFAAPKYGHVLPPACARIGELITADIGIPVDDHAPSLFLLEGTDAAKHFSPRTVASHKGDFGHVLVVAGSLGKTGAAVLAATAALRSGAGLVTVAAPAPAQALIATCRPEVMTEPLPVEGDGSLGPAAGERALALASARDVLVIGPGLGTDGSTPAFVRQLVGEAGVPAVIDADGLNAFSTGAGSVDELRRGAGTTLTPHPGEMGRLLGRSSKQVQAQRLASVRLLAKRAGATVVLKGHHTLICQADGRAAVNPTGNPGLSTAGSGDVLSGIIGALVARSTGSWEAACAGVFLHGLAGDLATERLGEHAVIAGDVIEHIGAATKLLRGAR